MGGIVSGKLCVHEPAKQLGATSKELLAELKAQDKFVKAASSTVGPPVVRRMKKIYEGKNAGAGAGVSTQTPVTKAAAKPAAGPDAKPAAKPDTGSVARPGTKPTTEPGAKSAAKPGAGPATPTAAKPDTKPAVKPSARPAAPTAAKPGTKPAAPSRSLESRQEIPHPPKPAGPKPRPRPDTRVPHAANNPFPTGEPSRLAPQPSNMSRPQDGNDRPGPKPGGHQDSPRPQSRNDRSDPKSGGYQSGSRPQEGQGHDNKPSGNRPTPAMIPSHPNPGQMPTGASRGGGSGGFDNRGHDPGGGPRSGHGGYRGGTAGAFGRPEDAPRRGQKSRRQKHNECEAIQVPSMVGGVRLPNGKGKTIHFARGASLSDFAEEINVDAAALVQALLNFGEMVTVTTSVSDGTLQLLGNEMGHKVQIISSKDGDHELLESFDLQFGESEGDDEDLEQHPPVVTMMDRVGHGKTRLLDTIRKTNVGSHESGGIAQHIDAYQVPVELEDEKRKVTFLDTPGHEVSTAIRARGARSADIAVLIVATGDGVMPQTVETINHAKTADVPIVVTVNKIDKETADPQRIHSQLAEYGLTGEEWGGDAMFVGISTEQDLNIDQLLGAVLLAVDASLDLHASPGMNTQGVAIETHLDRGRGPVVTVIVQCDTLRVDGSIIAGDAYDRVRHTVDECGDDVDEVGPPRLVQVLGLTSIPGTDNNLLVVDEDHTACQITGRRDTRHRNTLQARRRERTSLENLDEALKETNTLNLILKGSNAGAVEALEGAPLKIEVDDEVALDIIDHGAGVVTQTNITLAATSNTVIIGFDICSEGKTTEVVNVKSIDIRYYTVIYHVIEDVESILKGILKPVYEEKEIDRAEVRTIFKSPTAGLVADCMIESGEVCCSAKAHLVCDDNVIMDSATTKSLRREKDDATRIAAGYEYGMMLSYPDIQADDAIEVYEMIEIPHTQQRKLNTV